MANSTSRSIEVSTRGSFISGSSSGSLTTVGFDSGSAATSASGSDSAATFDSSSGSVSIFAA